VAVQVTNLSPVQGRYLAASRPAVSERTAEEETIMNRLKSVMLTAVGFGLVATATIQAQQKSSVAKTPTLTPQDYIDIQQLVSLWAG
jgi:hypothetical protein